VAGRPIEGGCFCGAVRYASDAPPTNAMICHCRSCQRAVGAPAVPWVTFRTAGFRFTAGEPQRFRSSAPVLRGFCGACGTPLTYEHAERPAEIDITTATLDEPKAFPPKYHAQLVDAVDWLKFGDGLPAYREWRNSGPG